MGVKGLWNLLDSNDVMERIDLDSIKGARIAIDTPIWISNITRGDKRSPSTMDIRTFCLALLKRIKKLFVYDLRPVFVLEGSSHSFKRKTLIKRKMASSLENEKKIKALARTHLNINKSSKIQKSSNEVNEFESFALHSGGVSKISPIQDQQNQQVIRSRLDRIIGMNKTKSLKRSEDHPQSVYEYIDVSFVPKTQEVMISDHSESIESENETYFIPDELSIPEDFYDVTIPQIGVEVQDYDLNTPSIDVSNVEYKFDDKTQNPSFSTHLRSQYELILVEILSLLKIPFCVSAHDAESQCAFLNESDLVDYVVSDDSDIFLFGNVKVIRNFYKRNHTPQLYSSKIIEKNLSLSRIQLILLALLVGCDYTSGIKGIGIVKGLSIVQRIKCDNIRDAYDEFFTLCNLLEIDPVPKKEIYTSFTEPTLNKDLRQFKWEDKCDFSELKFYLHNKIGMDLDILKGF